MFRRFIIKWKRKSGRKFNQNIDPDEIFLDSSNLPKNDVDQFEGRLEKPISKTNLWVLFGFMFFVLVLFIGRVWFLQVNKGEEYALRSQSNFLKNTLIFSERGIITDRFDKYLAWNVVDKEEAAFTKRKYSEYAGISNLIGYVKYPQKDKLGFYYSDVLEGKDGIEKYYNAELSGKNGVRIVEVNALGKVQSSSTVALPQNGKNLKLSIDAGLQDKLYEIMHELANRVGFTGGSGAMMDLKTGEVIFSASYPEYNSQVLTDGDDSRKIAGYINDPKKPFLNKVMDGAYTPGSIVKPFMALAALKEKIIDPLTSIYSSGQLVLPNPYDPSKPTIFKDWKALGYMDMRHAIAQSCDVYFYEIGGGFEKQKGLGIDRIYKYMHDVFGFGQALQDSFFSGVEGTVPSIEWKKDNFTDGTWRIGNTYHTSIGQYGFQMSPIQMLRAISAIPNDGKIIEPTIIFGEGPKVSGQVDMPAEYFKIVREGMRLGAIEGTGSGLNTPAVKIATKTGTAELGELKNKVNSWVTGFFPYDNPRYSFVVMMERGPLGNLYGATYVMRQLIDWMAIYRSEYFN